jgi:centromere-localized protein 2
MTSLHPSQPDEIQILTSYLLHPSPLPTILPYTRFQSLVPKAFITRSTELKRLYRDLQFQRDITIDDVRRRIESECRRSTTLQARLARNLRRETGTKRKREDDDEDNDANDMDGHQAVKISEDSDSDSDPDLSIKLDNALHGPLGNTIQPRIKKHNHTSASLLSSLAAAAEDLESEIASLETDLAKLKNECEERVGGLSDLRYGKFNSSAATGESIEKEVVDNLEALKRELNKATDG